MSAVPHATRGRIVGRATSQAFVLLFALVAPVLAWAHPGGLDEYGGHFDPRGAYHYHRPARDMAARKDEWLEWVRYPRKGVLKGEVAAIDATGALWVHMSYRPAYQEVVQDVAAANRDDAQQRVRVALAHVSPQETGARNRHFQEWFLQQVAHELKQKLHEKPVSVQFEVVGGQAGLLRAMVFQGEENVNLWLVLNGWSYYVLSDGESPYDTLFRQAEDIARRDHSGVWSASR